MILYHGSYLAIEVPDIIHSRNNVDFERAFTRHRFMIRQSHGAVSSSEETGMALFPDTGLMNQAAAALRFFALIPIRKNGWISFFPVEADRIHQITISSAAVWPMTEFSIR